jgi:hypothetical protein
MARKHGPWSDHGLVSRDDDHGPGSTVTGRDRDGRLGSEHDARARAADVIDAACGWRK